jgi:hypothetical protein
MQSERESRKKTYRFIFLRASERRSTFYLALMFFFSLKRVKKNEKQNRIKFSPFPCKEEQNRDLIFSL